MERRRFSLAHVSAFVPLLSLCGTPTYGQEDFQRFLDPVGQVLTICHDKEVRNHGLEKFRLCKLPQASGQTLVAANRPTWWRPGLGKKLQT